MTDVYRLVNGEWEPIDAEDYVKENDRLTILDSVSYDILAEYVIKITAGGSPNTGESSGVIPVAVTAVVAIFVLAGLRKRKLIYAK